MAKTQPATTGNMGACATMIRINPTITAEDWANRCCFRISKTFPNIVAPSVRIHDCTVKFSLTHVHDNCYKRGDKTARSQGQCRSTKRLIERRPRDSVPLAGPFFFEQVSQHFTLFQSIDAPPRLIGSFISLLGNTKLKVKLRQRELSRKTIRLQLSRGFQMVNGRINIARQSMSDPHKDMGRSKIRSLFEASGECRYSCSGLS